MKNAAIGIAIIATLIGTPALAADMPLKAPTLPAPVPSWTGFYLGADVGGVWTSESATWNPLPSPLLFGSLATTGTEHGSSLIGGVYGGYDNQFGSNVVAGIEADWSGTDSKGTLTTPWIYDPGGGVVPGAFNAMSTELDWLASVRGRLGYLVTPSLLAYATGGVAWGRFEYAASSSYPRPVKPYTTAVALNQTQTGFVVGGGLEWKLTQNWLVRAEYLYYGFNSGPNLIGTPVIPPVFPSNYVWGRTMVDVARAGLSYKF